ncbi:MAG: DUF937 domain-containing protein [Spirulinaceae cyanobacterium]
MSLFNTVLSALESPDREASSGQLANILGTVQQLSNSQGADASQVQSAMSVVGKFVRSSLQEKRSNQGEDQTRALVNQFSGTQPSNQAVQMLFNAPQLQQMIQEIESRTGLNANMIKGMLPMLVPLVLNFLKTGASSNNPQGSNSVLGTFLDADGDGDVDMADAMQMASRYIQK